MRELASQPTAVPRKVSPVAVVGPTAVGKSEVVLALARACGQDVPFEVVSADSMQVYLGLDLGTDKPSRDVRSWIPYHLIDILEPTALFSAGAFVRLATRAIDAIGSRHRIPLIVGGTGLYLRALRRGLWPSPAPDPSLRERLWSRVEEEGQERLHQELARMDPERAASIHPHNVKRVVRALEVFYQTGRSLTDWHSSSWNGAGLPLKVVGFFRSREDLRRRVEARVARMLAAGWVDEVEGLLARGVPHDAPALKGLGYRQIVAGLRAGLADPHRVANEIQNATLAFAKRQMTWFRREPVDVWINLTDTPASRAVEGLHRVLSVGNEVRRA